MKAIITAQLSSGLGDMHLNIYQMYNIQEQLKKIGYCVETIIDLGRSPYKTRGEDRSVFSRIFKLNMLDNLKITIKDINLINDDLKKNLIEAYKYEHIHTVFVDKIVDDFKNIHYLKHSWYYRDDLPKINLISEEVTEYAENKTRQFVNGYVGLHYRPFSSDDEKNIESDLELYKSDINDILEKNHDKIVFISTNKNLVKKYLKNSNYNNYYINEYAFPDVHETIQKLNIDDEKLFEILKESLCDMYFFSKCEKIYRIANWFSGFLSFSCLFNQTKISNKDRFFPKYSIAPL